MNDLEKYFKNNTGRLIHKWHHYFDVYEKHFSRFRNKPVVILEIGVYQGGSLQMWKNYFGEQAQIFGVDINPNCKELEEKNVHIYLGSQSDRTFLKTLCASIPDIDILIDDGGHKMDEQIITFEELFNKVKPDGVYLCEDTHTSYILGYGGGLRRSGTFVEYSKKLIDSLYAWHSEQEEFKVNSFTRSANSIHFYDGVIVFEKTVVNAPVDSKTGVISYENEPLKPKDFKHAIVTVVNKTLRYFHMRSFIWGRKRK
jgi:hypothetical protein